MNVSHTRELNILNSTICKQFGITNVEKQTYVKDEDDVFFDLFHEDLYTFSMNGKDYEEYISKIVSSNGNSDCNTISFKEIGTKSIVTTIYINQGGECPKCKQWHSSQDSNSNIRTCLECGFSDIEEKFHECFFRKD